MSGKDKLFYQLITEADQSIPYAGTLEPRAEGRLWATVMQAFIAAGALATLIGIPDQLIE